MVVTSLAKGKPLERVGRKTDGANVFKEAMPAGLPRDLGLAERE
jgi:hypothetical protein